MEEISEVSKLSTQRVRELGDQLLLFNNKSKLIYQETLNHQRQLRNISREFIEVAGNFKRLLRAPKVFASLPSVGAIVLLALLHCFSHVPGKQVSLVYSLSMASLFDIIH